MRARHPVIAGDRVMLRLTNRDDTDLLVSWFADPEVHVWWGGRALDRNEVLAKYAGARSPDVECFIVETAEGPAGMIEYWKGPDATGGIDMFIAPAMRGRGFGTDAARALARYLVQTLGWTDVTADPALTNPRGIAFWARAGFGPVREFDGDEGERCLLMRFDAAAGVPT